MKTSVILLLAIGIITLMAYPVKASSIDVSGYTDKGVYVYGELDVNSDGSVDGYVYTRNGRSIYVEGELESGGTVDIESDSWGGGGYELDID